MANPEPKVIKFEENGKLFLRAFLLDATKNVNGWKVVAASIPQNIRTFIGMPLVLDQKYDHPKWVDGGLTANIEYQQRFAIGTITDVVEKDGKWDAIIEITDPLAKDAIANNDIPLFVSPRLVHDPSQPDDAISDWIGVHLAVVDEPAFGDKAHVKGACYGSAGECQIALKNASKKEESCGFCVKSALLALVTKHNDSSYSSLESNGQKLQTRMENSPAVPQVDLSGYVPKADYDKLVAEHSTLKSVFEDAKKDFTGRLAAIEDARRKEQIISIVSAKIADEKKAGELVTKFVDAKVSPEFVRETLSYLPEQTHQKDNTEKFTAPVQASVQKGSFERASAYLNGIIKGAGY